MNRNILIAFFLCFFMSMGNIFTSQDSNDFSEVLPHRVSTSTPTSSEAEYYAAAERDRAEAEMHAIEEREYQESLKRIAEHNRLEAERTARRLKAERTAHRLEAQHVARRLEAERAAHRAKAKKDDSGCCC